MNLAATPAQAGAALARAAELAQAFVAGLPSRPVHATVPIAAIRRIAGRIRGV